MKIRNSLAYPKHMQNYNPLAPFVKGDMGVVPFFKGIWLRRSCAMGLTINNQNMFVVRYFEDQALSGG